MALAGSVVAAMKPAINNNADNVSEIFISISLCQKLRTILEPSALRGSQLEANPEREHNAAR
jgi:hypothetical protein